MDKNKKITFKYGVSAIIIIILLIINNSSSGYKNSENILMIKVGMNLTEVENIMGSPLEMEFIPMYKRNEDSVKFYTYENIGSAPDNIKIFFNESNLVTYVDSGLN